MVCLVFNLILFYVICKYISIQRKNWYVFYSVISIYVLLTVFLVSLLFEELIFFYVVMPRLLLFLLIVILIAIWSILSFMILLYSYLGWDFIYISNLATNQWYTCLELIYKTMYNLNFNWFAFQMQPEKYKVFRQHYSGNWCIILWTFFVYLFVCGLTQSAGVFYKSIARIFSIFPLKTYWFLPWICFWRNHMLQLEYNTMPTILFYNSSYKDKVFYKLMYSTVDLRVNNEYLSWSFILRHRSLHNLYHLGLLLNSNINSSDFKALVYLPRSWVTGKHFHVSMCQYPTVWKRFLSPLFIKQTSVLAKFKKKYGKSLPDSWFAYHDEKELLKQRAIYYNEYHSFFAKSKKGQFYRFCKLQMKKKMKKDEIKRQTLIKLRRNVKIFIYFLKRQRSGLLSITRNLTLLHFFYSVFLIEFRAYYKLNKYLSIKNIYFFFRKKSLFFFSTLILKNYRLFIYFSPYLLNFLTWANIYKYIKFKNFQLSLDFFQDYILQKDLFLFRFSLSFKLTNFFLLLTKKKNLISFSKKQTKHKNVFYTKHFKKILQNTIFLLTFQLTSNWHFTIYNLTNYFSFILTAIFRSLKRIKKQLKIKIFVKMFKVTLKARKNFGFRKFKKLPSKKINVI